MLYVLVVLLNIWCVFLRFECDILNTLLVAQTTMSDWKFLTALLHIQEAHTKLTSWGALIQPREVRAKGHIILKVVISFGFCFVSINHSPFMCYLLIHSYNWFHSWGGGGKKWDSIFFFLQKTRLTTKLRLF